MENKNCKEKSCWDCRYMRPEMGIESEFWCNQLDQFFDKVSEDDACEDFNPEIKVQKPAAKVRIWRHIDEEFSTRNHFAEIEKFMIYVQAEGYLDELDRELADRIIELAFQVRERTDYMSYIGCGTAIYSWLWWIFEDMEDDDIALEKIKIKNATDEQIKDCILKEWFGSDWQ